jgi:tetratricopeptide (TPR) repeat protein
MRKRSAQRAAGLLAAASLLVLAVLSGSSSVGAMPAPEAPTQQEPMPAMQPNPLTQPTLQRQRLTPEQQADVLYNEGISYRDKAEKLEREASSETNAKKKEKLEAKARDKHLDSIKKFAEATTKNPNHYSAWGNLGDAYRKTGDYTSSLEACQKALDIQPNYTPAMECRAEAYLVLNRLDDVKSAYTLLFDIDRRRADELAAAIDRWVEKKKVDPSGVDQAKFDEFARWAAQRKPLASRM